MTAPLRFATFGTLVALALAISATTAGSSGATVATCAALTPQYSFEHMDPADDQPAPGAWNDGRDITAVDVAGDSDLFCLTITFANVVDPLQTVQLNPLNIGFDTDEEAATGQRFGFFRGHSEDPGRYRCGDQGYIGADAILQIPEGTVEDELGSVELAYTTHTVTAAVPIAALGGDSAFNFEVMLTPYDGDYGGYYAHDCAPNGASLHSPNGALVPPQDDDLDGTFDSEDNCPGIANDQADSDVDGLGDICDPTPTHGFRIVRYNGKARVLDLASSASTTIRWKAVIQNVYPWESPASIDASVLLGLPTTCDSAWLDGWPPRSAGVLGPYERVTIEWTTLITCDAATPPGAHRLRQALQVYYEGQYRVRIGWANAEAEVTLRINNPDYRHPR